MKQNYLLANIWNQLSTISRVLKLQLSPPESPPVNSSMVLVIKNNIANHCPCCFMISNVFFPTFRQPLVSLIFMWSENQFVLCSHMAEICKTTVLVLKTVMLRVLNFTVSVRLLAIKIHLTKTCAWTLKLGWIINRDKPDTSSESNVSLPSLVESLISVSPMAALTGGLWKCYLSIYFNLSPNHYTCGV